MELQDNGGETSAGLLEKEEASLEVLRLFGLEALVNGVMPDFPAPKLANYDHSDDFSKRKEDVFTIGL